MTVVTANGFPLVSVDLHVPHRGAWWARLELVDDSALEGSVNLAIDELELVGTVVPEHDGTHGGHRRALIFAGAAGWGAEVAPSHYRSDTGVRAALVAEDAARAAGERLGTFEPAAERLGPHYVRQGGLARRVLEDAIGDVLWWVDYEGATHVAAARPELEATADAYRVLDYDPLERLVTLEIQTPSGVVVGSRLSDGLDEDQIVRELDLRASADGLRMQVWTGSGRYGLADSQAFAVHRRYSEGRLWGAWRYRVVKMTGELVDARPVLRETGLPDLVAVELSPGVPGIDVNLPAGLELLIEFVEGNRALPRIVGFAGHDQASWEPLRVKLAAGIVELGDGATHEVALHNLVEDELSELKTAISGAAVAANDGGATFKANILAALTGWPGSTGASKVRAE